MPTFPTVGVMRINWIAYRMVLYKCKVLLFLVQVIILWILCQLELTERLGEEMPETNAIRAFLCHKLGLKGKCRQALCITLISHAGKLCLRFCLPEHLSGITQALDNHRYESAWRFISPKFSSSPAPVFQRKGVRPFCPYLKIHLTADILIHTYPFILLLLLCPWYIRNIIQG